MNSIEQGNALIDTIYDFYADRDDSRMAEEVVRVAVCQMIAEGVPKSAALEYVGSIYDVIKKAFA